MTAAAQPRLRSALPSPAAALARRAVLRLAGRLAGDPIVIELPGRSAVRLGARTPGPAPTLRVHDDAFFARLLAGGEVGFGEAYVDRLWSSPDLVGVLRALARNQRGLARLESSWWQRPWRAANRRLHRARSNTRAGSRANIAAHYDIGNDLYALFLDRSMTYSSGLFATGDEPLEEAITAKHRRVAQLAGLRPGMRVLELGGGWGSFAVHAAREHRCHLTMVTISAEQAAYARERVEAEGLAAHVDVQRCDYRDARGTYDAVVAVGIIEAIGAAFLPRFFEVCDAALAPGGRLVLEAITVPQRAFARQRDGVNWLQKHIFPGGMLPSLAAIEAANRRTQLLVTGVQEFGIDYASTLAHWSTRFHENLPHVRRLGYDERFVRTWQYYLALCEAGFRERLTQNSLITLEKPGA